MWLVAGLGNPGRRYQRTRHNVGFDVIDELARRAGVSCRRSWRFPVDLAEARIEGARCLLLKPRNFMNRSGLAIAPVLRRKGLALSDLIVIVDDVELPCGRIRIRRSGSAGGHNGLKSVIAAVGGAEFPRIRVGVGGRSEAIDMSAHVLSGFTPAQRKEVDAALIRAADAIHCITKDGLEKAMNEYNG